MRRRTAVFSILILTMLLTQLSAQRVTMKIGSTAPENSVFGEALKEIAAEWREISDGRVQLRLYFAGFKNQQDLLRKIRFNQLQGGVVDGLGLQQIYGNVMALSVPGLIQSGGELDYVLEKVGPDLAEEMEKQGFILLDWAKTGWIYFFARNPARTPEELMRQSVASPGGENTAITNALKHLGFNTVNVATSDVFSSLTSGMVDVVYGNPLLVAANQWFGIADNMINIRIAPFMGGIVVSSRAWKRVPEELKPELRAAVERVADRLDSEVLELEQEVIETMKERGLNVVDIPEEARAEWQDAYAKAIDYVSGREFSEEFVQRIEQILKEYRSTHAEE